MKKTLSLIVIILLVLALFHSCGQVRTNERAMNTVRNWWDLIADRFQTTFCQNDNSDEDATEPTDGETDSTEPTDGETEPTEPVEPEGPEFFENSDKTVTMCRYEFTKWARDNEYGAFNVPHTDPEDRVVLPDAKEFEMFKVHFGPCEGGTELDHDHDEQPVEFMLSGSSFSIICCKDEEHGFDELLWDGLPEALRFAVPETRVELCKKCNGIANVREVMGKVVSEELTDEEWADLEKVAYYWWEIDEETNEMVRVFGIRTCGCDNPDTNPGGNPSNPTNPTNPTDPQPTEPTHEHKYTETVTAPDCENGGYTTHTCECGDTYKDNETDPLGHDWGEWIVTKQPTTTEDGLETSTCKRCGKVRTNTIPALGKPEDEDPEHNDPTEPEDEDPEHNDPTLPEDDDDGTEDQPDPTDPQPNPDHNDQVLPEDDEDDKPEDQPQPEDDMVDLGSPDTDDGEPEAQPQPEDDMVDLGTPPVEDEPEEQPAPEPEPDHNDVVLPSDDEETESQPEAQPQPEDDMVDLGTPPMEDETEEQLEEQPVPEDDMVDLGAPEVEDEPEEQPAPQPEPDHNDVLLPEDDDVTETPEAQPEVPEEDVVDLGAPVEEDEAESQPPVEENDSAETEIPVEGENISAPQPEVTEDDMVDLGAPVVEEENVPEEQPAVQEPVVEEEPAETPADNEPAHSQVELPVDDEPATQPESQPAPQPQPEETVDLGSPAVDDVVDLGSPE